MMTEERMLVARAVIAGQLPASVITDAELYEVGSALMDAVIERLAKTNPMTFSGCGSSALH
jgi:hypothetical protein